MYDLYHVNDSISNSSNDDDDFFKIFCFRNMFDYAEEFVDKLPQRTLSLKGEVMWKRYLQEMRIHVISCFEWTRTHFSIFFMHEKEMDI